jgi:hypothetical protein
MWGFTLKTCITIPQVVHPDMTSSAMLTIQYLEDSPTLHQLDREQVINKLRLAAEILPFTHLLIGWNLPPHLLEACRTEADRLGMRFLRWHPLLTGDGVFQPQPAWQTVGLSGHKVMGYRGMPEFTFVCPNHPEVQEGLCHRLEDLLRQGLYQGFFLDRVRFPSPAADPLNDLGCFCEHCQRKAADQGLDLQKIQREISQTLDEKGRISLIYALLTGNAHPEYSDQRLAINQFLLFRKSSVRDFLAMVARPLREARLEVGLDCFSASLTHMVGQDLNRLSELVDWIKLMAYAHTFAPAGIPYECSGLAHFLSTTTLLGERQSLDWMGASLGFPLPISYMSLETNGLSPFALEEEVRRGVEACSVPALAGMELVELEGVTNLNPDQIRSDLSGLKRSGSAGLAISWDLLHIPLERLSLVRQVYLGDPSSPLQPSPL